MKNYEKEKQIIDLLQTYKDIKKENAAMTPKKIESTALDNMFSKDKGITKESFQVLLDELSDLTNELKKYKKRGVAQEQEIKDLIGQLIEEDVTTNETDRELIFSGIGTVRCKFKRVYLNNMTPEQKKQLIQDCVQQNEWDVLDISDEKLYDMDDMLYEATGEHLPGITVTREIETKITVR